MSGGAFDRKYFHSAAYARVSFARYSQYWWSNRFYALLARRYAPQGGRALEIGCGLGHLLGWLSDRYQVFGADVNAWALGEAQHNVPQGRFLLASAEELGALPSGGFQVVIAKHVVEHLPRPERAAAEMARLLTPGGILLLATPNLDSPMRGWKKERWIGYQDPTHISLKPPADWLALLRAHRMRPQRVFSDGFWDAPYLPLIPAKLQKLLFGAPGGLQAILGWSIIPLRMGESLIVIAEKE
ncbi:MAG: class I SAM-dependent methyltransferase [Chloroflexi bacterium]|nr:class I SAM-dependent methyltransferase [Chloroflexota bacterium]